MHGINNWFLVLVRAKHHLRTAGHLGRDI